MWHGKKEKKNNTKYSGHFVPLQRPRAAHALRLDQNVTQLYMVLVVGEEVVMLSNTTVWCYQ